MWNRFFNNSWFYTNFYNSICGFFCFFIRYNFPLFFIIRSSDGNFSVFTWSYFFFFAHFKVFVIDILRFKCFFYFCDNWFCSYLNNFFFWLFSLFKFAFFCLDHFTIFDYKSVCSLLFSWCSSSFFSLTSFKIFVVFNSSLERYFFLFNYFYFMSSFTSSLSYLDKCIFCWNNLYCWLTINLRIFDLPGCCLGSYLTWFFYSIFACIKIVNYLYFISKWNFFCVCYFTFSSIFTNKNYSILRFFNSCEFRSICYFRVFDS